MKLLLSKRILLISLFSMLTIVVFTQKLFVAAKLRYVYAFQDTVEVGVMIYDTLNYPLPKHVNTFLNNNLKHAQRYHEKTGFPASVALAQGMLESNYGRSSLSKKANNFHGIIYCKRADKSVVMNDGTSGAPIKWSGWNSVRSGWKAYFEMMADPKWIFKSRWEKHKDKDNYFELIARSIASAYAEDPLYATKLINLEKKYNLTCYD